MNRVILGIGYSLHKVCLLWIVGGWIVGGLSSVTYGREIDRNF